LPHRSGVGKLVRFPDGDPTSMKPFRLRGAVAALLATVLAAAAPVAGAWGPTGHRIVAELAERQLDARALAEVRRLLRPVDERSLADIATWPDDIRNDGSKKALWKATSPLHYINFRDKSCAYVPPRDCPDGRCVVGALERYVAVLRDRHRSDAERLDALRFVVHFVGDIHQPLHAGYRGDRGGNQYQVQMGGKGSNLHKVWDSGLLGTRDLRWKAYAQRLANEGPVRLPAPIAPLYSPYALWAEESCRITRDDTIYPRGRKIGARYVKGKRPIAERRLREAGKRLANLLNKTLG
jgi:hypothetical protein